MNRKKTAFLTLLIFVVLLIPGLLLGADDVASLKKVTIKTADAVKSNAKALDIVWTLLAAFLVFFMQAGFALVETGFTRAKNSVNIMMKNLMDFSMGVIAYYIIGYSLMFGIDKLGGLVGFSGLGLSSASPLTVDGLWQYTYWLFQAVFAATAATIVSGAMAERTKFSSYLIYSVVISAFIYPVVGHWIWGGGFLSTLKPAMIDFAGSTVVHSVGGWAALMGALILGPRLGKYGPDGKSKAIRGHNIPLAALGVFILFFGWFGFNAGSTTAGTNFSIGTIAATTALAAAAAAIASMIVVWIMHGKPDASMTLNGVLAGLVGITAGCASVSPFSAIMIGLVAGVIVVFAIEFIDKVLKIDDPVGAISVHGVTGAWGTLAVGLFADAAYGKASGAGAVNGLFHGGGLNLFWSQLKGVASVFLWVTITAGILFLIIKYTMGLKTSDEEQLKGLDVGEHGMEAYSGFQIFTNE